MAAFISGQQSIHVAAVTEQSRPTLTRGLACSVNEERTRVRILLSASRSQQLLRALACNPRIAAVFSNPEDNKTLQLKGVDAEIAEATEEDRALLTPYIQTFAAKVQRFNVQEIFVRTLFSCEPDDLLTVSFTPITAFKQTPGNNAGDPIPLGVELS
ncbi:hypothetical protein ADIMK_0184 [Marinobacterium lacunae]|uniref:Uncharacterized protein n=1 Tax=Marinobacterium lacunae TaxID=1232683 RepID=A0A081G4F7_9GAMM|nr:hypothetical protein ADIMK_0184 [Marinobacterium lacunae]